MNRNHWRTAATVLCLINLVAIGSVGVYLYGWWQAWNRLYHIDWTQFKSPEELREIAERTLRVPLDIHDPCIMLMEHGDSGSVPYLIGALKWQPNWPTENGFGECTKGHCLDALKKITGVDAGLNYEDWRGWYENSRR